ncbi:carbon-phosphorus lyase, partial [Mesorhizobium sp. M4A.F.Ca.ET.020.02.1.1]
TDHCEKRREEGHRGHLAPDAQLALEKTEPAE